MSSRYWYQNEYLDTLEKITAEIILTNKISKGILDDIEYLNKRYYQFTSLKEYYQPLNYQLGNFQNKIDDYMLNEFIEDTNNFYKELYDNKIKLSQKNFKYLKHINSKVKEINSIADRYCFSIRAENESMFLSDAFANAINEMNYSIDIEWFRKLDYEKENKKGRNKEKPKPEEVYGYKVFSEDEAREVIQKFLGDLGTVKEKIGSGESRYDDNKRLEHIDFRTSNGYRIEINILGGKINELRGEEWDGLGEENKKVFDESQINISREDAINKIIEFLSKREINSLEIIEVDQYGPVLEVRFAQDTGRYLNMAAYIDCKLDLTRGGRLLRLSLEDYWIGLAYDDSRFDYALNTYDNAKNVLDSKINITKEKLVGKRGEGLSLDYFWRFTTKYDGEEYYIYVNPQTGEEDVEKVKK